MLSQPSIVFGIILSLLLTSCAVDRSEKKEEEKNQTEETAKNKEKSDDSRVNDKPEVVISDSVQTNANDEIRQPVVPTFDLSKILDPFNLAKKSDVTAQPTPAPEKCSDESESEECGDGDLPESSLSEAVAAEAVKRESQEKQEALEALNATPPSVSTLTPAAEFSPAPEAVTDPIPVCDYKNEVPEGATEMKMEEFATFLTENKDSGKLHLTEMTLTIESQSIENKDNKSRLILQLNKSLDGKVLSQVLCKEMEKGEIVVSQLAPESIDLSTGTTSVHEGISGKVTSEKDEIEAIKTTPSIVPSEFKADDASIKKLVGAPVVAAESEIKIEYTIHKMNNGKTVQFRAHFIEPTVEGATEVQSKNIVLTYSLE